MFENLKIHKKYKKIEIQKQDFVVAFTLCWKITWRSSRWTHDVMEKALKIWFSRGFINGIGNKDPWKSLEIKVHVEVELVKGKANVLCLFFKMKEGKTKWLSD